MSAQVETRRRLDAVLDSWFEALVDGSPEGLPVHHDLRFTEQTAHIALGDGLFVSATDVPKAFKIVATDEVSGNVGAIAMLGIWGKPSLVTVRLRVRDGLITEAEHLIVPALLPHGEANLQSPRATLLEDCPVDQRTPRDAMWRIANSYFDAVEQDDGDLCPLTDDCARRENGMQTTMNPDGPAFPIREDASPERAAAMRAFAGMTCRAQLSTGLMSYINTIRPRRLQLVDEVRGLVLGFPCFNHRGQPRRYSVSGVPGYEMHEMAIGPNTLQASELFQIRNGKVTAIEATGTMKAYRQSTGWDDIYPETYDYDMTHPRTHPFHAGKGAFLLKAPG